MKTHTARLAMLLALPALLTFSACRDQGLPTENPNVTTASAKKAASPLTVPVTGTFTDALGGIGTFTGNFTLTSFTTLNGALAAVGTLTGTLTNSLGQVIGTVTQSLTIPVSNISGSCQILHLELGPLDLDLLGLMVHLDKVVLDITAQSGSGNLLGNLLCGIAGLLDSGAPLSSLVQTLNQLLGLLKV